MKFLESESDQQSCVSARIAAERDWHDKHFAGQRRRTRWLGTGTHEWLYSNVIARRADRYMASLILEFSQPGQNALECGCGSHAKMSLRLKNKSVQVFGFDISFVALTQAAEKCRVRSRGGFLFNAAVERLPISSESVDLVVGESVLHHCSLQPALIELKRVLRRGGICIFREPLKGSPVIRLFRWLTPADRTATEKPLDEEELDLIREVFALQRRVNFFLLAPLAVGVALISKRFATWLWNVLTIIDEYLIYQFPALGRWCWQTVVVFQKPD